MNLRYSEVERSERGNALPISNLSRLGSANVHRVMMRTGRVVAGVLLAFCFCYVPIASQEEEYHCVWYGECGRTERNVTRVCVNDTIALPINDPDAEDLLQKRCPHLFEDGSTYI